MEVATSVALEKASTTLVGESLQFFHSCACWLVLASSQFYCAGRRGLPPPLILMPCDRRIWPHNYGKWMDQIDPMGTSVGRWCVGKKSNLLGQNTRQTIPGKNMSFELAPGLFGGKSPTAGLHVRVGFYDEGSGSWELHYATNGGMKLAAHVKKTDTREFIEIRLKLTDLDLSLSHGSGAVHFLLTDPDAKLTNSNKGWASSDPDVFAYACIKCCAATVSAELN
eukprot:COSAG01_NODE_2317_length_7922_cov_18.384763_5_plen_224_part_00